MKKKPIEKKQMFDIVLEDREGRTESVTYGGSCNDEYLIKYIAEKLSKIKLGQKLTIKLYETFENN